MTAALLIPRLYSIRLIVVAVLGLLLLDQHGAVSATLTETSTSATQPQFDGQTSTDSQTAVDNDRIVKKKIIVTTTYGINANNGTVSASDSPSGDVTSATPGSSTSTTTNDLQQQDLVNQQQQRGVQNSLNQLRSSTADPIGPTSSPTGVAFRPSSSPMMPTPGSVSPPPSSPTGPSSPATVPSTTVTPSPYPRPGSVPSPIGSPTSSSTPAPTTAMPRGPMSIPTLPRGPLPVPNGRPTVPPPNVPNQVSGTPVTPPKFYAERPPPAAVPAPGQPGPGTRPFLAPQPNAAVPLRPTPQDVRPMPPTVDSTTMGPVPVNPIGNVVPAPSMPMMPSPVTPILAIPRGRRPISAIMADPVQMTNAVPVVPMTEAEPFLGPSTPLSVLDEALPVVAASPRSPPVGARPVPMNVRPSDPSAPAFGVPNQPPVPVWAPNVPANDRPMRMVETMPVVPESPVRRQPWTAPIPFGAQPALRPVLEPRSPPSGGPDSVPVGGGGGRAGPVPPVGPMPQQPQPMGPATSSGVPFPMTPVMGPRSPMGPPGTPLRSGSPTPLGPGPRGSFIMPPWQPFPNDDDLVPGDMDPSEDDPNDGDDLDDPEDESDDPSPSDDVLDDPLSGLPAQFGPSPRRPVPISPDNVVLVGSPRSPRNDPLLSRPGFRLMRGPVRRLWISVPADSPLVTAPGPIRITIDTTSNSDTTINTNVNNNVPGLGSPPFTSINSPSTTMINAPSTTTINAPSTTTINAPRTTTIDGPRSPWNLPPASTTPAGPGPVPEPVVPVVPLGPTGPFVPVGPAVTPITMSGTFLNDVTSMTEIRDTTTSTVPSVLVPGPSTSNTNVVNDNSINTSTVNNDNRSTAVDTTTINNVNDMMGPTPFPTVPAPVLEPVTPAPTTPAPTLPIWTPPPTTLPPPPSPTPSPTIPTWNVNNSTDAVDSSTTVNDVTDVTNTTNINDVSNVTNTTNVDVTNTTTITNETTPPPTTPAPTPEPSPEPTPQPTPEPTPAPTPAPTTPAPTPKRTRRPPVTPKPVPTIVNRTTETIEIDDNKEHKVLRPPAVPEEPELRLAATKYDPRLADASAGPQPEHATVAVFTARGQEESSPSTIDAGEVIAKRKVKIERFGDDAASKGDVEEESQLIDADTLTARSPTKGRLEDDRIEAVDDRSKDVFKHGDNNGTFDDSQQGRVLRSTSRESADGELETTVDKDEAETDQTFEDFNGDGTVVESGAKRALKRVTDRVGDDVDSSTGLDQQQKSSVKSMDEDDETADESGAKRGPKRVTDRGEVDDDEDSSAGRDPKPKSSPAKSMDSVKLGPSL